MVSKIVTLFSVLLTCCGSLFSQTPFSITNQRSYSGGNPDIPVKQVQIDEQRKLLLGHTQSSESLDHQSSSNGMNDIWIIEEENNSINWEKSVGGSEEDYLVDAIIDHSGNVLLLALSNSPADGDKSENPRGSFDYWIVKMAPNGDVLWDKTIGGSGIDNPGKIIENNTGYLILGNSVSPASGDKTEDQIGGNDIWIVQVDFDGNIVDQSVIGTTESDKFDDALTLNDEELLISSTSFGEINNDKVVPHYGTGDCWLFKYNYVDKIISNQISLGGTDSEELSKIRIIDNKVYVLITSLSEQNGNKTSASFGNQDAWFVRLDNQLHIEAQNSFGGNNSDFLTEISYNTSISSNIFLLGSSDSEANTGLKNAIRFGERDGYLIEVEKNSLNQISDTVFGGFGNDGIVDVHYNNAGLNVLLSSASDISGNKTVPLKSIFDFWLLDLEFEPNSITEMRGHKEFYIFPNPANEQIQLKGINKATEYFIYDAQSRIIIRGNYSPNDVLSVEELAAGIYFLKLEGYIKVEKLLVR